MEKLTKGQSRILGFIQGFQRKQNMNPTLREIMNHCKFKSIATVQDYLVRLEKKHYIKKRKGKARSIVVSVNRQ